MSMLLCLDRMSHSIDCREQYAHCKFTLCMRNWNSYFWSDSTYRIVVVWFFLLHFFKNASCFCCSTLTFLYRNKWNIANAARTNTQFFSSKLFAFFGNLKTDTSFDCGWNSTSFDIPLWICFIVYTVMTIESLLCCRFFYRTNQLDIWKHIHCNRIVTA